MVSSECFRRQAAVCLRLAATAGDENLAGVLVAMADDFSAKADEIDPNLRDPNRGDSSLVDSSLGSDPNAAKEGGDGARITRRPGR
jgi:hypothetical protein